MGIRIVVLASGRGSNLRALLDAGRDGRLGDAEFVAVISDRPRAGALHIAADHGVPTRALEPKSYPDRESFDNALGEALAAVQPDLIVCAGYMRIIASATVARFAGRMINIHPSLLPKYPGLHTHARALAAGDRQHGASVHVVIPELDAGPVLTQALIEIEPETSAESLAARVLEVEHPLLTATVALIATGRLQTTGDPPRFDGRPLTAPLMLEAIRSDRQ